MKYWDAIADNLSKAGWSWGCVSAVDSNGRAIWIVDAHRDNGKRFISGVEPVFPEKRQAIDYAETRACFRCGEIRVLNASGKLERTIAFNETNRKL